MNTIFVLIMRAFILLMMGILLAINNATANDISPFSFMDDYQLNRTVKSVKALRNVQVVRQQYDFNCAAASLATLLNYQYGESFSELGITNALLTSVEPKKRAATRKTGFSLFEIEKVSHALGYKTAGYKFDTLDELKAFNFPSIVRVILNDTPHFVVLKKIKSGRVFLADPAWGNRSMTRYQFSKIWQRHFAFFVLPKDKKLGDKTLKNALTTQTPVVEQAMDVMPISPDVWLQQDFDKFIINATPATFSKH